MFKFSDSADFLRQFKQGERPALEKVYLAYVDEVEATVRRFLIVGARSWGRSARVDVGDLVQETFVRAFGAKGRKSFDGLRDYGPFLGALTRNLLVDWARRSGREVPSDDLDRFSALSSVVVDDWADGETMSVVNQYIVELPVELRELHDYRYVQCRTQEDTCAALGISRQTLRTREKHLCDGLRRRLRRLELAPSCGVQASDGLRAPVAK